MADPIAKALDGINRTLKDIADQLKKQTDILKAMSNNYVEVNQKPGDVIEEPSETGPVYIPKEYGWSMAALAQREGTLRAGDIKIEQDESRWVWTGTFTGWERIEEPSAREPD